MALTGMQQHMRAMLSPETDEERRLVTLYRELDSLCQNYKGDPHLEVAILSLARTIIRLFDAGVGRLDQTTLDQKVRETVQEAGFNAGTI